MLREAAMVAAHGTEAGSEVILVSKEVGVGCSKNPVIYNGLVRSQESSTYQLFTQAFPTMWQSLCCRNLVAT